MNDLGVVEVPTASRVEDAWIFRAACHLKNVETSAGVLMFGLTLDLGFGIYHQIKALLGGVLLVEGREHLAAAFAENWAANGLPNPLEVVTLELSAAALSRHRVSSPRRRSYGFRWLVHVYRVELALETLEVLGRTSLVDALEEQGLVTRLERVEPDA